MYSPNKQMQIGFACKNITALFVVSTKEKRKWIGEVHCGCLSGTYGVSFFCFYYYYL